jgi:redox-sensing transcriptional repressor
MNSKKVSFAPSIRRLPSYLHIIKQAELAGEEYISGTMIANELNLDPIQVRKDLSITGILGKPKRGYPIRALVAYIEHYLGWDRVRLAFLVGAGNLGSALLGYQEFRNHGLSIVAAFDTNPDKIGHAVSGIPILHLDSLASEAKARGVRTAILTVPSSQAQVTADILVSSGIDAIWNFTNAKLKVPDSVLVQKEDLSSGYALLCVMMQHRNRLSGCLDC